MVSLIIVTMKDWTVTVTSTQPFHITVIFHWSTEPTISTPILQDNIYKSVRLAQTLLDRNVRVCGTMRANRGISRDLEGEGKHLNKEKSEFRKHKIKKIVGGGGKDSILQGSVQCAANKQ